LPGLGLSSPKLEGGNVSGGADPVAWEPGAVVGRYRIEALLGRGGMGEVWRATDPLLRRAVALKRLPPGPTPDAGRRARFLREARTLAALDSPGIVSLFAAENLEDPDPARDSFLVMELVEGESLDEILARRGPLPFEEVLDLLRQVARALADAHRAGVVHRDLKPANILLRPDGRLVVIDFGLALLTGREGEDERLTRSGMVAGTASYMSPEQARGEPVGPASDVWAAGILAWEMLAGAHPFAGVSVLEQLAAILRDPIPPIETVRPDVPAGISELLCACLAKEPGSRPPHGGALLSLLPREHVPLAAPGAPILAPEVLARSRAHEPLSRRVASLALLLALLGVSGVVAISWRTLGTHLPGGLLPPSRAPAILDGLLAGLPPAERATGFRAAGTFWLADAGPVLWARRSPESMLHPWQPPGPGHPRPGLEGDVRLILDPVGRLLLWDWWPASEATVPDQLGRLAAAAGAVLPLVDAGAGPAQRGVGPRILVDGALTRFAVAEKGGQVLRFAREGIEPPAAVSQLRSAPATAAWIVLLAALAYLIPRNRRSAAWDLRGAAAFGAANAAIQLLKVVFNPVTVTSGIWVPVTVESLGHGVLCAAAYAAFEPVVRRAWPGAFASWARFVVRRRADEQVGRELLVGSAAALPAAAALLLASLLPGRAIGDHWGFFAFFGLEEAGLRLFILFDLLQLAVFLGAIGLLVAAPLLSVVRWPGLALSIGLAFAAVALLGVSPATPAGAAAAVALTAILVASVYLGGLVSLMTALGVLALGLTSTPPEAGSWALFGTVAGPALAISLPVLGWWLATRGRGGAVESSRRSAAVTVVR
jgi:hypothetical protein